MIKKYLFWTFILPFLFSSCKPESETIINEIIVRDTVYINQEDTLDPELGGLKLSFSYISEFGYGTDTIISGTEVRIENVQNVSISPMNKKGEVLIEGLISGRTYGIDILHKGNPYAQLQADRIGTNVHLEFGELLRIVDVSKSEINNVSVSVIRDFGFLNGIKFTGSATGIPEDSSYTRRGLVAFVSRFPDVSPVNNDFASGRSFGPDVNTGLYNVELVFSKTVIETIMNISSGDTIYYTVHGGTGPNNNNNGNINGYPTLHNEWYYAPYPNVNPKGISGWIVYE